MRRKQFSLLTALLLMLLMGSCVGVYMQYEPWRVVLHLSENQLRPCTLALTLDGRRLALGVEYGVEVWDVPSRTRLARASEDKAYSTASMSFTPDGKSIVYTAIDSDPDGSNYDPRVVVRDAVTLQQTQTLSNGFAATLSPDGKRLFVAFERRGRLCDFPGGLNVQRLNSDNSAPFFSDTLTEGIFVPKQNRLFTYEESGQKMGLWNASNGNFIADFNASFALRDAALIPQDSIIALATYNGLIFLDLESRKESQRKEFPQVTYDAVAVSQDGSRLAVSSQDDLLVFTWPELKQVAKLVCPGASKYSEIAISDNGDTVAISSYDYGEAWVLQRQRPEGPLGLLLLPQSWVFLLSLLTLIFHLRKNRIGPALCIVSLVQLSLILLFNFEVSADEVAHVKPACG